LHKDLQQDPHKPDWKADGDIMQVKQRNGDPLKRQDSYGFES